MTKVNKYSVLSATNANELEAYVNEALENHWFLVGGVVVAIRGASIYFYQSMAKAESNG